MMKSLFIILACFVTISSHAKNGDSTTQVAEAELLPIKKLPTLQPNINIDILYRRVCRIIVPYNSYIVINRKLILSAGTRNMNYYINFAAGSSSIGYDDPHFGGARADGNAIFIDDVRLYYNSAVQLGAMYSK